ncbi:hypothetical protein FRB96_009252 [Tulasnella sp. 330]|nr:hypothetical protein FRB96_009252 [Tulasnella sp. 330]KAG8883509.1 hypothetical protein FRB97_006492 [Tulasnella sp. 331]KAG8889425.1 hypothetical protein FRB98_004321 [Tulasnella sp. 332]
MSLSPAQAEIVFNFNDAIRIATTDYHAHRGILLDDYVVKFNQINILSEGDTQGFVYKEAFKGSPNAPRVPEVYECFSWNGMEYIAMELIHLPDEFRSLVSLVW